MSQEMENSPPLLHDGIATHNTLPLLHEIRHALERLVQTGEPTVIDLRAIPLTPTEERELETLLGHGEVDCQINTLGKSSARETAITGVWWISHYNSEDELMARSIEVTTIPTIIPSDKESIREGLTTIVTLLEQ